MAKFLIASLWALKGSFSGDSVVKNSPDKQDTCVRSPDWKDPQEKETATHSSILAWEIPRTEEPGRLKSMRSQRIRQRRQCQGVTILFVSGGLTPDFLSWIGEGKFESLSDSGMAMGCMPSDDQLATAMNKKI